MASIQWKRFVMLGRSQVSPNKVDPRQNVILSGVRDDKSISKMLLNFVLKVAKSSKNHKKQANPTIPLNFNISLHIFSSSEKKMYSISFWLHGL